MADMIARVMALTDAAKQMGMNDKDAYQYAKDMDRDLRTEERNERIDREKREAEREARIAKDKREAEERIARETREAEKEERIAKDKREAEERIAREIREAERAEREAKRAHQFRLRELELQANHAHFSPAASPTQAPSETHSNTSMHGGLGQFTLPQYRESVETIDVYLDRFAKLAEAYQIPRDKWKDMYGGGFGLVGRARLCIYAREFNLQIQDVTIDDEDWYECQVQASSEHPRGMRSQRAFLSVVVHPERPSIVGAPTIPVVLHTPTNITCRADKGKPGAHITWHLDGQRLTYGVSSQVQPRGKYLDTIGVLTFNATLADAAKKIECQAITEFMESPFRTFATLDVQFAPDLRMTINVTGRNLREHDYIQFQCMGRANPASVIWSWFRNDHPIKDATSNTFYIEAVSPEYNKNKISCEATNTVGSSRVDTILNIEYGARIQGITEVVGADVGHPAELSCEADGNPEPSVIWRRKDRTTYAHRTLSTKKVFQIERVSSQDFGWYVCTATVIGFPDTSREAMLLKNDRPNMRSERQQMATEGERGKLECLTNSIPKPKSIIWSKGGKEINYAMSGRFSKEDKDILYGARSVLHIQSVHSEDFGIYNCTVENDYGVAFDQIELVEKHVLPITYIIISIIGGVAVIFVIALVCVLYRRCKKDDQGSYADTDSSSDKKREKTDSPNTLMGQLRQDYNKDVYRFSADYDDMPYKEQQAKGNNNGYGYIEPYEAYSDNQIYDGEYVHRGDDLIPERLDPAYNTGTAYSMSSFRRSSHDSTPPPTMTRLTSLHMSDSKLATDV